MIFETHAHYDDEAFEQDRDALLSGIQKEGIGTIINVAADLKSVETSLKLSEQYDFIYAAVGIHPSETMELNDDKMQWLKDQAQKKKVVAIGEIGLDYYWKEPEPMLQKKWFEQQLNLAKAVNKPVIIHSRDASADTLNILCSREFDEISGVIHCYSYSLETAKTYLKKNYYFGIGGVITFSNAKKLQEVVEYLPLDHILLETDSPYLAPVPNRGKRNSSLNIPLIAEKIAQIKEITYDEVVEQTRQNAEKLFFR